MLYVVKSSSIYENVYIFSLQNSLLPPKSSKSGKVIPPASKFSEMKGLRLTAFESLGFWFFAFRASLVVRLSSERRLPPDIVSTVVALPVLSDALASSGLWTNRTRLLLSFRRGGEVEDGGGLKVVAASVESSSNVVGSNVVGIVVVASVGIVVTYEFLLIIRDLMADRDLV
jgi:hypothetical protein